MTEKIEVKIKIKEYQSQLDLLLNQYTERHPDVQALQAIIEDLKKNYKMPIGEKAS